MQALWVPLALGAGLFQSVRNGFARSLSGVISPALNSWSRFAFNLPFACLLVAALVAANGVPSASPRYYALCLGTGITQLLGNVSLVAAFRTTNFAQAIVLHKLEIVFTALAGALFFSELPAVSGWVGILVCVAGVILMQLARVTDRRRVFHLDRGSLLAILAGLLLVLASFLLKDANTELATLNPRVGAGRFEVAGHTLFNVTWMEVLLLTVWLVLRAPQQLSLVEVHWRRMLLIGLTGFLGSLGWFWAYSLTLVAYVKAVGQIEAVAAVGYALFIFKEREVLRQLPGMALVIVGILVVLVSQ
jgi:drug/metabolite transporter (DMT)-like permease